jgi:hypothetical protein
MVDAMSPAVAVAVSGVAQSGAAPPDPKPAG